MLEVYAFPTPNSVKVPIALEEMGLDYQLVAVDLRKGEQKTDAFRAMNPVAKVPVLVDRSVLGSADVVLSESAPILVYLAEKTGQLLPKDGLNRSKVFEQLFFHASALSPAFLRRSTSRSSPRPIPRPKRVRCQRSRRSWVCSTIGSSIDSSSQGTRIASRT
jgi:GST-like protein